MQNHDIERVFKPFLFPEEEILWTGRPRQGIVFRTADIVLIPFSLVWGGFAFVWEFLAISGEAPLPFVLFGLIFVFAGIYLIFGRFFVDARRRRNTLYAITKSRLLIMTGLIRPELYTVPLFELPSPRLSLRRDGSGSVAFTASSFGYIELDEQSGGQSTKYKIDLIEDPERVHRLLLDLMAKSGKQGSRPG